MMLEALWITAAVVLVVAVAAVLRSRYVIKIYGPHIRRIFEEDPIFNPTEGTPHPTAEEVAFERADGHALRGCYLNAATETPKGVVVFCHEFGSDRWSGVTYWEYLQTDGFDIFAFDFRNHGTSDPDPNYKPRHWVTEKELADLEAALVYLRSAPRARGLPIGLFGISRGGGTSIGVAAVDRDVRCVVTDGAFPTHGTVLTYMRKWMSLVVGENRFFRLLPDWYLAIVRDLVLGDVERDIGSQFARLERAIRRIAPRPIFMIHGGRDSYIRPDIARQFFACARQPCELWIVDGARHNACLETEGDEYRRRVLQFFRSHLAGEEPETVSVAR